jgi:hypothetical protein
MSVIGPFAGKEIIGYHQRLCAAAGWQPIRHSRFRAIGKLDPLGVRAWPVRSRRQRRKGNYQGHHYC